MYITHFYLSKIFTISNNFNEHIQIYINSTTPNFTFQHIQNKISIFSNINYIYIHIIITHELSYTLTLKIWEASQSIGSTSTVRV